jgi:ABC-type bacteriocin/lantibiotic exporter with double-glycine peptidase domain
MCTLFTGTIAINDRIAFVNRRINSFCRASMEILAMMSNMIRFAVAFATLLSLEWRLALISFASFPLWYYVILKLAMWSRNKTKEFFGAIDQVRLLAKKHVTRVINELF